MNRSASVLVVDDNADDVLFIKRALKKAGIECPVNVVGDGDSALEFLEGRGRYADESSWPHPTLVLLDLKLPRRSGLEVLEALQPDPGERRAPIVVLSGAAQAGDIARARAAGAIAYLTKPISPAEIARLIDDLGLAWLACHGALPAAGAPGS